MPAQLAALQENISRNRGSEAALLRAALRDPTLAEEDRLWLTGRLAGALRKGLKRAESMALLKEGARAAAGKPIYEVFFARHMVLLLADDDKRQEALAEYTRWAPRLAALSGTSGQLHGEIEAAEMWLAGGTVLSGLAQLPEATELLVRALAVFDRVPGQAIGQAASIGQIALVNYRSGDVDGAVRQIKRAIDIGRPTNDSETLARLYMRLAHFMSARADVEAQYEALIRARKLAMAADHAIYLAVIATNLSDVALQRKDYRAVLRYVDEAVPLVQRTGDRESLLICSINKGLAMNRLGQREGLVLVRQAIDEFSATPGKKNVAAEVQGALAEELAFNGQYEQAYKAAVEFKVRSDEVRKASDQKRIADSTARYQADKKQRQIEVLEQEQRAQKRMQWLWALAGALGLLTAVILIISRVFLKRAYRKVEEMSLSDPLTGLRNRRYLASRIDEDLAHASRQGMPHDRTQGALPSNADVVFMMIDLDHFKQVNDIHGHAAGDAVLKQFSAILVEEVRDADTVVRWGGEEFLIVAKHTSSAEIHLLAERIRARVAGCSFDIGGGTFLRKTCSIGFATYPGAAGTRPLPRWEDVVALADQCLYAAKASGRDMWVGIVPAGNGQAMPRLGDARLGVEDGVLLLQHSAGRDVMWQPEHVAAPALAPIATAEPAGARLDTSCRSPV